MCVSSRNRNIAPPHVRTHSLAIIKCSAPGRSTSVMCDLTENCTASRCCVGTCRDLLRLYLSALVPTKSRSQPHPPGLPDKPEPARQAQYLPQPDLQLEQTTDISARRPLSVILWSQTSHNEAHYQNYHSRYCFRHFRQS